MMKIPLCIPNIDEAEIQAAAEAIRSGWLTDGPKNTEFEENFAGYLGVKHAVSLNSCASALQLALEAHDIKGEVILPGFTFAASANAVVRAGAKPVFADIDYATCNIDPQDVSRRITSKTEAIMVVHYAGQAAQMDEIISIAKKHGTLIIEDAAETIGGLFDGKRAGSFGTGCFSFFPTKNMTTGEGGMLTTDDEKIAGKTRVLAGHGMAKTSFGRQREGEPWHREAIMPGYNFRMSNILAAIGVIQLGKLEKMNEKRRKAAQFLNEALRHPSLVLPSEISGRRHVYQMYTLKLKDRDRTAFIRALRDKGIMASVHFTPPVHLHEYYARTFGYKKGDLPVSEEVADEIVTLPLYPQISSSELEYMAQTVKSILE